MVVRRLPPRAGGARPTGALAMAVVLLVAIGVWLLGDRDLGTGADPGAATDRSSPAADRSPGAAPGGPSVDPASGLDVVEVGALPDEAVDTIRLIDSGGPFPHAQDGSTFGNVEGLLPDEPRGYYAEYTVETPGSEDRGARRIVGGDEGELYWTADHYASFERVRR